MLFIGNVPQSYAQADYQKALSLYQEVISGQKKIEDLSPEQQRLVIVIHQSLSASDENIEDYDFSLRDIEKKCEVYKYSDSYGDVECRGSSLRIIEKKCEAYFYDPQNGELECRGSDFRAVERKCSVSMYSESYGEIDC
jgi:hypothetical protein